MKKIINFIAGALITLLIVTSCQPRYVIIPIPSKPSAGETTSINNVAELRAFLEKSGNGKAIVNRLIIDPTVENLPITVNGIKEIEGSLQVGNTSSSSAYSINLLADTGEQTNVPTAVFYVPTGTAMNLNNLSATISEEAVSSVSALIEVDTGNISLDNVSITVPDSVNTTQFSTIKTTENTKSDNISISASDNVSVFIPENNNDESLKNEIEESGTEVATPYDVYSLENIQNNLAEYGKARLTADLLISQQEKVWLMVEEALSEKEYIIDLNNHTLRINSDNIVSINENMNLCIKDGNLIIARQDNSLVEDAALEVYPNSTLTFDHVNYTAKGHTCIMADADNAKINIDYSILTGSYFALSTNATADSLPQNLVINIRNKSKLIATENVQSCAVLFNIDGTINITDSYLEGNVQALVLRGGNCTLTNSTLVSNNTNNEVDVFKNFENNTWASSNGVPYAVLVIGNYSNSYNYTTTCNIDENTSLTMKEGTNTELTKIFIASYNGKDVKLYCPDSLEKEIREKNDYRGESTYINDEKLN